MKTRLRPKTDRPDAETKLGFLLYALEYVGELFKRERTIDQLIMSLSDAIMEIFRVKWIGYFAHDEQVGEFAIKYTKPVSDRGWGNKIAIKDEQISQLIKGHLPICLPTTETSSYNKMGRSIVKQMQSRTVSLLIPVIGSKNIPGDNREEIIGIILLGEREQSQSYSKYELRYLNLVVEGFILAVNNVEYYRELEKEVAEHQRTARVLKESEERFRLAFGQAGVGMALVGLDWQILDANDSLCHSLGYDKEELTDLSLRMVAHVDYQNSDDDKLSQLKRGEIPSYQVEKKFLLKSGEMAWFRLTVSLIRDPHDEPLYLIAQMENITRRKVAEEALAKQSEDLKRSNQELEQFAYIASHDLQEPLRMVSSYSQLLARRYQGQLDTDADEFIAYLVDGANRMKGLINDLLAYSRVQRAGKDFETSDSEGALDQAVANLRAAIKEHGAEVSHDALPTVMADTSLMVQVFQNLIGNAIKFHGRTAPKIHVSAKENESKWIFSVRDNGIGIDLQYADRIFGIFQRLHGREEYPGTGIGLAICKKIVEHHGGTIWVESQPEEGSTFYFELSKKGARNGNKNTH